MGTRASGLVECRQDMLGAGTAPRCEVFSSMLTFGLVTGLGYMLELGFPHFFLFWTGTQVSLSLAMNLMLLCTFYDWVFICLSLLYCCFEIGGLPFWIGYVLIG